MGFPARMAMRPGAFAGVVRMWWVYGPSAFCLSEFRPRPVPTIA